MNADPRRYGLSLWTATLRYHSCPFQLPRHDASQDIICVDPRSSAARISSFDAATNLPSQP